MNMRGIAITTDINTMTTMNITTMTVMTIMVITVTFSPVSMHL